MVHYWQLSPTLAQLPDSTSSVRLNPNPNPSRIQLPSNHEILLLAPSASKIIDGVTSRKKGGREVKGGPQDAVTMVREGRNRVTSP